MNRGYFFSALLHALVILAALFGVQAAKPFEVKPVDAIQVDISNITDETKVKAQSKSDDTPKEKPKPKAAPTKEKTKPQEKVAEEKKLAVKQEPVKQEPPPEKKEPPKPKDPPKPKEPEKVEDKPIDPDPLKDMLLAEEAELKAAEEAKKKEEEKKKKDEAKKKKAEEEKKKKEEEAAEKAAADAKAKADAKKKADAEKKQRKLDIAQLEDLLNKENEEAQSTLEQKDEAGTPEKAEKDIQGTDDAMSATLAAMLKKKYKDECWDEPPAAREADESVVLSWKLARNGTVVGQPIVIGGNGGRAAQQAAIAAVFKCAPYSWLPADGYKIWRDIEWNFGEE